MKIIQVADQNEGGKVAVEILRSKLAEGTKTLGLATGSSPLSFYKELIESDIDLSDLVSVNLDEYVGQNINILTLDSFSILKYRS